MNIAIFGDSFANGETDMGNYLAHYGLTQYLTDYNIYNILSYK